MKEKQLKGLFYNLAIHSIKFNDERENKRKNKTIIDAKPTTIMIHESQCHVEDFGIL